MWTFFTSRNKNPSSVILLHETSFLWTQTSACNPPCLVVSALRRLLRPLHLFPPPFALAFPAQLIILTLSLSTYLLLAWIFSCFLFCLFVFVFSEKLEVRVGRSQTGEQKIKPSDVLISPCSKKENYFNQLPTYSNQDFTLKLWIYNLSLKTKNRKIWQQLTHIPLLQPSAGAE